MTEDIPTNRPLVTFALFAYNQEQYICEAVEGAFSQTYEPLEIILSDDFSTDRTFDIMQEMAASYEGPHEVRVRRNAINLGIIDHFLTVAHEAEGQLFVVAAGDDISYPDRTEIVIKEWLKSGAMALFSACDVCDDDGNITHRNHMSKPRDRIQKLFRDCKVPRRFDGTVRNIPGYSAAYDIQLFAFLRTGANRAHNEDALMTYVVNLKGGVIQPIEKPLICRRDSLTSISVNSRFLSVESVRRNELVVQSFASSTLRFYEYFATLAPLFPQEDFKLVMDRLSSQKRYLKLMADFWSLDPGQRIKRFLQCRQKEEFKYVAPRLIGMKSFCLAKKYLKGT